MNRDLPLDTTGVGIASDVVVSKSQFGKPSTATTLVTIWNSMIVATDLFISLHLIYIMTTQRSAVKSTNSILRRIMLHGVATGVLSSSHALFVIIVVGSTAIQKYRTLTAVFVDQSFVGSGETANNTRMSN
ncbi:hypothetical protein DL93DRAFT_2187044 [Clavulina sp. PMI_390]|nr:hypothetical protein DL93DRAFT_2187044 [Clavulina sp. PMI_390]